MKYNFEIYGFFYEIKTIKKKRIDVILCELIKEYNLPANGKFKFNGDFFYYSYTCGTIYIKKITKQQFINL